MPLILSILTPPLIVKFSPPSPVWYTPRPLLVHPTVEPHFKIQDQTIQGAQHISWSSPSVCTHSGTPRLSGPELMPPCSTSKELIGVSSNPSLMYPLVPIEFEFQHLTPPVVPTPHHSEIQDLIISSDTAHKLNPSLSIEEMMNWIYHLSDSLEHSNSDLSLYILNLWLHLILSTAPIIDFPSNMPYSQAMQSSSSTIALQPLISRWLLDSDDYCIYSKNHHRLYPPPHAKLSHLKSIIK